MNHKEDSFLSSLLHLIELTSNRKHQEIKDFLESPSIRRYGYLFYKGILPENFVAELLIGNNSWAKTTSMRDDHGIDIIEFTRAGYNPCKCYQIRNNANPLCNADVYKQIEKFKRSEYRHLPYYILSISGFGKTTLTYPNVHLINYEYVVRLINNYSKNLNSTPSSTYLLRDDDFILRFDELLNYVHAFGYCYYIHLPCNLKNWCIKIIKEKMNGKLNIEKISLMDKIGFCWSHSDYIWNQSFDKISKIYFRYGSTYENMEWSLKPWLKRQIDYYLSGDLSSYKAKKLESISLISEWILNI